MDAVKPKTPFQRYLMALGDEQASELLSVRPRTVQSWRLGERLPRPQQALTIVSRAPLSLDDIYGTAKDAA